MTSEAVDNAITGTSSMAARKFGVADAMILVAGLGLALGVGLRLLIELGHAVYYFWQTIAAYGSPFYANRPKFWRAWVAISWSSVMFYGLRVFEIFLVSMTPAFLLVRLRRPRPPIVALLRQPGTVAGLAMSFGQLYVTGWLHLLFFGRLLDSTVTAISVGATVAVAWTLLALSRKWKGEPGWVDRMGRLLGAAAIVVGAISFKLYGIWE
jgi:hypothetical protein